MIVSFEGPDFSGKSTQVDILSKKLIEKGLKVKVLHFPRYYSPIGELIGKFLDSDVAIDFTAIQMLYVADQLDFQNELEYLLSQGYIIILDRYDLSTIAYYICKTNTSTSISTSIIDGFNLIRSWQSKIRKPDITFIFNYTKEVKNRRDIESFDILEKDDVIVSNINQVYLDILGYLDDRKFFIIDANESISSVAYNIEKAINIYVGE